MTGTAAVRRGRDRRRERLRAREYVRDVTTRNRVRACGKPAGELVRVRAGADGVGFAGLMHCASPWECPVCASKIADVRARDLVAAITTHAERGGWFGFWTLTIGHGREGDPSTGAAAWDGLLAAWRRMGKTRAFRKAMDGHNVLGTVRTVEATHQSVGWVDASASRWHVHMHVLVFVEGTYSLDCASDLGGKLVAAWLKAVEDEGFRAVADAQDWQAVTKKGDALVGIASYMSKGEYRDRREVETTPDRMALEMSRHDLKQGRGKGRSPFEILADLLSLVEDLDSDSLERARDAAVWCEWAAMSMGRRQQWWSKGLRDGLCLDVELSDEEAASVQVESPDVAEIMADDFRRYILRDPGLHYRFLACGSALDPAAAVVALLVECGIPHVLLHNY